MPVELVTDQTRFDELMSGFLALDSVAVDTEFVRVDTFFPLFGLIQFSDGDKCYLADPLSLKDLTSLKRFLQEPGVVKVLHSCSEDLEVFNTALGCVPVSLFDTQTAAALLGQGYSLSYQALVAKIAGVHIPKEETRSNWLQRPLTEAQMTYAAQDVSWLPLIYKTQTLELEAKGRSTWMREECQGMAKAVEENADSSRYYLKVGSAWKLNSAQLGRLKILCSWREEETRKRDMPRNRLLADKMLFNLARSEVNSLSDLADCGLFPGQVRRYGDTILGLVGRANKLGQDELPEPLLRPVSGRQKNLIKQLKLLVEQIAEHIQCAPELLARKKHLEELVRSLPETGEYKLPLELAGWRRPVIGDLLMDYLLKEIPVDHLPDE